MSDFFHVPEDRKKISDPCIVVMINGTYEAVSFKHKTRVRGGFKTREAAMGALRDEVLKTRGIDLSPVASA